MNKMAMTQVTITMHTAITTTSIAVVPIIMRSTIRITMQSISIVRATPALVPADVTHTMVIITSMAERANG